MTTQAYTNDSGFEQLAAVIPLERSLSMAGVTIPIRQIKLGSLPAVLIAVQPLRHMLSLRDEIDIASLFMLHADECMQLLTVLSGQNRRFIDDLEIDDGVILLTALLEVNADFFIRQVLPKLTGALALIADKLHAA